MQGSPLESSMSRLHRLLSFFFNDTATTEIYTLSLHDALPISGVISSPGSNSTSYSFPTTGLACNQKDRKSTRLNSSHLYISYAVFCLKKTLEAERDEVLVVRGGAEHGQRARGPPGAEHAGIVEGRLGPARHGLARCVPFFFLVIGVQRVPPLFPSPAPSE